MCLPERFRPLPLPMLKQRQGLVRILLRPRLRQRQLGRLSQNLRRPPWMPRRPPLQRGQGVAMST